MRKKTVPLRNQIYSAMLDNLPAWMANHIRTCPACRERWYTTVQHVADEENYDMMNIQWSEES